MALLIDPVNHQMPAGLRKISRNRVLLSLIGMVFLLLILIARLAYLQIIAYSNYATLSTNNRVEIVPIPPVRGQILDRNGNLLAGNKTVYTLGIVPAHVADLDKLLDDIKKIIPVSESELKAFRKSVKRSSRFELQTLKDYLTDEQIGHLAVDRYRLPGAYISAELHRNYYSGEYAAHVIGRVSRIDEQDLKRINPVRYRGIQYIGKYGAELSSEESLVGWPGYERVETNAHGQKLRTLSQVLPTSGRDIYLTIDLGLQKVAYDAIGDNKGALVALEPATGRILAMVSKPSFDANDFGISAPPERLVQLLKGEQSPLLNRGIQGLYSPGSAIKPFLAIAANETQFSSAQVHCPGWYQLPGVKKKYRCWKKEGHGKVDLRKAIAESCDVYFYALARKLGIDEMYFQLSKFGFGHRTGVELENEVNGLLPSQEWKRKTLKEGWYKGETLITGIGQGAFSVTMLQLAHAVSIIANRGEKFTPQIILKSVDINTGVEDYRKPDLRGTIDVTTQNFEKIIDYMIDVVHGNKGTAKGISEGLQYKIAGKTGTVQVIQRASDVEWDAEAVPKKFHPHGIFMAFAPAEKPEIVIAVIIENGESGSSVAPIARTVMDYYLLNAKTKPQGDKIAFESIQ